MQDILPTGFRVLYRSLPMDTTLLVWGKKLHLLKGSSKKQGEGKEIARPNAFTPEGVGWVRDESRRSHVCWKSAMFFQRPSRYGRFQSDRSTDPYLRT